jgi:aspartate dehydrogenase
VLVPPLVPQSERHGDLHLTNAEEALLRPVDLVIEAAVPEVIRTFGARILRQSDLCAFSCTALADPVVSEKMAEAAGASGHQFHIPHGALLALDGLADGRGAIDSVTITTTKSGCSLGADPKASGVLFEGSAREACGRFPRNVNVHASVALAGIGFDRTQSRIVAVPGQETMEHLIEVRGPGLSWNVSVSSRSLGGVTGSYTPLSAVGSIRRILDRHEVCIA